MGGIGARSLAIGLTSPVDGSLEVWVENASIVPVWFDDLTVERGDVPTALVVQEAHYDPWGLELAPLGFNAPQNAEDRFKFNGGSERETGLGLHWDETPFRPYDAQLGRFHGIDLLADLFPGISPMHFGGNNPIMANDPTGLYPDDDGSIDDNNLNAYQYQKRRDQRSRGNGKNSRTFSDTRQLVGYLHGLSPDGKNSNYRLASKVRGDGSVDIDITYSTSEVLNERGDWRMVETGVFGTTVRVEGSARMALQSEDHYRFWSGMEQEREKYRDLAEAMTMLITAPVGAEMALFRMLGVGARAAGVTSQAAKLASPSVRAALTNLQLVQKAATKAEKAIGGTGRFAGTAKHEYATALLERYQQMYGNRGLRFKVPFNNSPGNRGFLDVQDNVNNIIYDWKFGYPNMTPAQLNLTPKC